MSEVNLLLKVNWNFRRDRFWLVYSPFRSFGVRLNLDLVLGKSSNYNEEIAVFWPLQHLVRTTNQLRIIILTIIVGIHYKSWERYYSVS